MSNDIISSGSRLTDQVPLVKSENLTRTSRWLGNGARYHAVGIIQLEEMVYWQFPLVS